jgi:5'-nucleotidase
VRRAWGATLLLVIGCVASAKAPEPLNPVRFLLINDVYVADTMTNGQGGLARVATVRSRLADQGKVVFVLAGDLLSPSLLSKYYGGRQMVEALNAAKLDYATFGNHEFELPRDTLVARIAESNFKWLSANCTQADGTAFPKVRPWDTLRVSKHLVGMFGLTLKGDYRSYVRCGDPDSAAHQAIDTLGKLKADLIVGLTHQSIEADRELLAREPGLDLILGGHEHEAHDSVVTNRHVLKADANARTAQFVTLWGGKEKWRQAVGLVPIDNRLPDDSATAVVVHRWEDSLRARLGPERVVATATDPIDARDVTNRRRESALGDLVTDAMRAGTGASVALINAGAMRLDDVIPAGPVSNYQLESIFLFADETRIVTFPLTGGRLREVLEHGVADASLGKGGFLQVSGIAFAFDPGRPSGSRIDGPVSRPGGGAIGERDTVTVAFGAYAACHGGDGYQVPEAGAACAAADSAPRAVDLLTRYIADSLGGKLSAPTPGRIRETGKTNPG